LVINGLNDRVATTTSGTTRRYVYDADGRILGEYGTSAADVKAEYLWLSATASNDNQSFGGDDGTGGYTPLAVATAPTGGSATLSWVHTNHLGVPLTTTDATGTEIAAPSTATALGFPGQMKTLPDLWYNRHRDYDPTSGRYVQADPIGLEGDANPYGYASANPLGNIDPDGLESATYDANGRWRSPLPPNADPFGDMFDFLFGDIVEAVKNPNLPNGLWAAACVTPAGKALKLSKIVKLKRSRKIGGKFLETRTVRPGHGPGQSRAEYVVVKNEEGRTVRTYKDSYDRAGSFQGRKPLRGGPEGRGQ
jgi:RHS repeat-associated protein